MNLIEPLSSDESQVSADEAQPRSGESQVNPSEFQVSDSESQSQVKIKSVWIIFSTALWILFLIVFLSVGWKYLLQMTKDALDKPIVLSQYDGIDTYLSSLKIPYPSETILAALEKLPPGEAILFVCSDNDPFAGSISDMIAYLGWPQKVIVMRCGKPGEPTPYKLSSDKMLLDNLRIAGVMFFMLKPPTLMSYEDLGPYLKLVPASGVMEWKSYCY